MKNTITTMNARDRDEDWGCRCSWGENFCNVMIMKSFNVCSGFYWGMSLTRNFFENGHLRRIMLMLSVYSIHCTFNLTANSHLYDLSRLSKMMSKECTYSIILWEKRRKMKLIITGPTCMMWVDYQRWCQKDCTYCIILWEERRKMKEIMNMQELTSFG